MSKMTKRARILAGCLALLAAAPIPATAAKVQQDSAKSVKSETAPEMEQETEIIDRLEKADARHSYPQLTLHGDYRFLYGKGRFHASVPDMRTGTLRRTDQAVFRAERRLRLFPVIETSANTSIRTMLEDKRDHDDADRRKALFEPAADADAARAALHADVHEHEVRPVAQARLLCQLRQGAGRTDSDVRRRFKDLSESLQKDFLVIHEQDIDHRAPSHFIVFSLLYHRAALERSAPCT